MARRKHAPNLLNQRFGQYVVTASAGRNRSGATLWTSQCDCGVAKTVKGYDLEKGNCISCGCLKKAKMRALGQKFGGAKAGSTKHRHSAYGQRPASPSYHSWQAMKQRSLNPNASGYPQYGALGVTVCDRWKDSFENFLVDMGERPTGTTLGRFGDVGNYEKSNCAWMTPKEQWANHSPVRDFRGSFKKMDMVAA
jgi:hypothetical protein